MMGHGAKFGRKQERAIAALLTQRMAALEEAGRTTEAMRSISRRIRRLEEQRFGTAVDIEFSRRLRQRMEAGRQPVAELREREGLRPPENGPHLEARLRRFLEATARMGKGKAR